MDDTSGAVYNLFLSIQQDYNNLHDANGVISIILFKAMFNVTKLTSTDILSIKAMPFLWRKRICKESYNIGTSKILLEEASSQINLKLCNA